MRNIGTAESTHTHTHTQAVKASKSPSIPHRPRGDVWKTFLFFSS